MDQVELLKMYAVRLAQRLGDNQKCLEFTASRDTGYGVETMLVEVRNYDQYVRVVYHYEGCHANQEIMLVFLYWLRNVILLILQGEQPILIFLI